MNSLERYLATIRGDRVDHYARLPILMRYAAEQIGRHYGEFCADYRVLVEANLRCAQEFGIDQMNTMSDPYRETHAFGGQITYVPDGVPLCAPPLENTLDLSALAEPDPLHSARMADRVNAVRTFREKVGKRYSVMGWVEGPAAEAADLRTVGNFFLDLMDDEGYAGSLMDRCVEVGVEFARRQIQAGADTIGIGDAVCSQVSPELYERAILPREMRLVKAIKAMGAIVRLHICGNVTHLLPGMAELACDVVDIDHMVDLGAARRVLGPKAVLTGNVGPVSGVLYSTPERIREAVSACIDQAGWPYMVNAGCEIPSGTPPENLKALCEPVEWRG